MKREREINDLKEHMPIEVIKSIKTHILDKSKEAALLSWESSQGNEDAITGCFCGLLSTYNWIEESENWRWRILYKKFRSNGNGAYEKITGADGIITVSIKKENEEVKYKSIIFQAKKGKNTSGLAEQQEKMDQKLPEGNCIFYYDKDHFFAKSASSERREIGDYLANVFIECKTGVWGIYYCNEKKKLIFEKSINGKILKILKYRKEFPIKMSMEIEAEQKESQS